ncbi:HNH endonuclease signature motif containing protein [Prescottella equi]|uniref:HNH endonuclease signature motif containing protein n=1 Tax=Rhodococcus hoagii TaxID=43767 RepID=UPI0035563603
MAARVATKVVVDGDSGCHVSTYSVGSHGYAQIGWQQYGERIVTLAHRVAWIAEHGPIQPGFTVDHVCKNRKCVNVQHLRLLSNFENARRTSGRDWELGKCVHGHGNEHLRPVNGGRKLACIICRQAWQRRYNEKRKRRHAS